MCKRLDSFFSLLRLTCAAPPAFITAPPAFVEVLLGESVTLGCVAHGNPKPTVAWRRDDGRVAEHNNVQVITKRTNNNNSNTKKQSVTSAKLHNVLVNNKKMLKKKT